jgi:formylglycine-generating enzyme required for sulfatase activity
VWEWCSDWFNYHYYSNSGNKNPKGADAGEYRVIRGGSWDSNSTDCRVSTRRDLKPDSRNAVTGFRLVFE